MRDNKTHFKTIKPTGKKERDNKTTSIKFHDGFHCHRSIFDMGLIVPWILDRFFFKNIDVTVSCHTNSVHV